MKKEMLINVLQPEECRIAIVEDGVLEELYVERTSQESYVGNIYKGRIVNIEPSIQAAFVDFGIGRNGFLHVSDVEPAYYRHLEPRRSEEGGRRGGRRRECPADQRPREETEQAAEAPTEAEEAPPPGAESAGETEGTRERRSGRGRGRSRRRGRAEPSGAGETPPPVEGEAPEAPPAPAEREEGKPPDGPRFMNSAERRTEEDAEQSGAAGSSEIGDDDLFFPRATPGGGAHSETAAPEHPDTDYRSAETPAEEEDDFSFPGPEPEEDEREPYSGLDLPEQSELQEDAREYREEEFDEEDHTVESLDEEPPPERQRGERDRYRRRGGRDDRRGRGRRMSGRPGAGRPKPLIQDIFRRGQEVLVQVIKEGIGTKGPTLSTYISIAGRYLVLMPGLNRVGVSRKIADEEQRRRLREIFHELQPPKGLGFIIRTAGMDKTKKELQRDLAYLARLWQVVVRRIRKLKAPAEIYQESDMITRTIRDIFTSDIDTIWVDETTAFEHAEEFLQIVMPRYASRIKHYTGPEPLFHKYGIEEEIARIQQRHVPLPNGGSIVIDPTEALVAIDVNSGNFRADNNAEETAYRMNLYAAKEIARQLRLRDLGGVIVNDFIDMRDEKHRRDVERALREAVKRDRARTKILRMSAFALIEMTRQRIRPSLKRSVYQDCPYCHGTSQVKTCESMSIDVMRLLQLAAHREHVQRVQLRVHEDVSHYLLNRKRKEINRLEESGNIQVTITGAVNVSPELLEFSCYDNNNNEVKFQPFDESRQRRR
jgi:ribonuclease E